MTLNLPSIVLTPSLLTSLAFVIVWIIAMLRAIGYARLSRLVCREQLTVSPQPQPISVVLTTCNQCAILQQRLPLFLEQQHPAFEIIVVDMNSSDDTLHYLTNLALAYPTLHICSLPQNSKDVNPEQLALTLGLRSAQYEWILFTHAGCQPSSKLWLHRISSHCTEDRQMVIGYTRYHGAHGWTGLRYRFFRFWQQTLNLTHALRHYAYRCDPTNLCYRKSTFLQHKGFADATSLLSGYTDIMVNRHSNRHNTSVCLHPDSIMLQDCPETSSMWRHDRLYFMETRRHLQHYFGYRLRYASSVCFTWFYSLVFVTALVVLLIAEFPYEHLSSRLALGILGLLWLIHLAWRSHCIHRSLRRLGERPMLFILPLLLHLVALWDAMAWLRHLVADKKQFRKKYL